MAELINVMQDIVANYIENSSPVGIVTGMVSDVSPLKVLLHETMLPIPESALILTSGVVEKKIPVIKHTHVVSEGTCQPSLDGVACWENGIQLPTRDGYMIINRGLEVGDVVVMLRVDAGQSYVVLSRSY